MSALGQKQTFAPQKVMSALAPMVAQGAAAMVKTAAPLRRQHWGALEPLAKSKVHL
jgi:hypothetical protein